MSHALKILSTMAVAAALMVMVPGAVDAFRNEPDGFRGIKWGTKIGALGGMEFVRGEGAEKYYARPDEKLKVGDAVIERITYGFYRDEFYKVTIRFKGLMNYLHLKKTLTDLYGDGDNIPGTDVYSWSGKKVAVVIEFKGMLNEGEVLYLYKPIMEKLTREVGAKPPKGAGDL